MYDEPLLDFRFILWLLLKLLFKFRDLIDLLLYHSFIAFGLRLQLCHFLAFGEDLGRLLFDFFLCFGCLGLVLINKGLRPLTTCCRLLTDVRRHGDLILSDHILQGLNLHHELIPFILHIVRMGSLRLARLFYLLNLISKFSVFILFPCQF